MARPAVVGAPTPRKSQLAGTWRRWLPDGCGGLPMATLAALVTVKAQRRQPEAHSVVMAPETFADMAGDAWRDTF